MVFRRRGYLFQQGSCSQDSLRLTGEVLEVEEVVNIKSKGLGKTGKGKQSEKGPNGKVLHSEKGPAGVRSASAANYFLVMS